MARETNGAGTRAADYTWWFDERIRFADLDLLGHVNNKAFLTYIESGRAAFLREIGLWVPHRPRQNLLARVELDYLRQMHYPGEVRVGMRVLKIGRSSFTLGVGLFCADACAGIAVTVMVRVDTGSGNAVPLDADERAALEPYRS